MRLILAILTLALLTFGEKSQSAAAPQPRYRITLITQPGARASGSTAKAINDRGQVTGVLTGVGTGLPPFPSTGSPVPVGQFYTHAFLYSNGQVTDLGAIGDYFSNGNAINNHGQVVGATTTNLGADTFLVHPFLSTGGGKMVDLGNLGDFVNRGEAFGINDAGIVVGYSPINTGEDRAFLYQGMMRDLGLGNGSIAVAINLFNQIVGTLYTVHYNNAEPQNVAPSKAFILQNGKEKFLATLGGTSSTAVAINNFGQVLGTSQIKGDVAYHAFLYTNGRMTDLGAFTPSSVNFFDQVVGSYVPNPVSDPFTSHAVLWKKGKMVDLNSLIDPSSGWVLSKANGINDLGQIVGGGSLGAFILTPLFYPLHDEFLD
jgi:probable HAF family extracellular repeat protein